MRGLGAIVVACALGGCQILFPLDAADSGGPPDEDGDGDPDAVDNCPNLPNEDQADADNDGVGDRCDPDVASPAKCDHEIALFDPFDRDDLGDWATFGGSWTIGDGKLSLLEAPDDTFASPVAMKLDDTRLIVVGRVVRFDPDPDPLEAQPVSTLGTFSSATIEQASVRGGYLCETLYRHDLPAMFLNLGKVPTGAPSMLLDQGDLSGVIAAGDPFVLVQDDRTTGDRACTFDKPPPGPVVGTAGAQDGEFDSGVIGIGGRLAAIDFESVVVVREVLCP